MSKTNVVRLLGRDTIADPLTELLRIGSEQRIYQAVDESEHVRNVFRKVVDEHGNYIV